MEIFTLLEALEDILEINNSFTLPLCVNEVVQATKSAEEYFDKWEETFDKFCELERKFCYYFESI